MDWAIGIVAMLTAASGLLVILRLPETLHFTEARPML
jgi:hypothetical protein